MNDDEDAVASRAGRSSSTPSTPSVECVSESRERIFGTQAGAAAMREDQRTGTRRASAGTRDARTWACGRRAGEPNDNDQRLTAGDQRPTTRRAATSDPNPVPRQPTTSELIPMTGLARNRRLIVSPHGLIASDDPRCAATRGRRRTNSAALRALRDPRQPDRPACAPAARCSPASSATTRRSCRRSSTRSCRATTSSCSACAARPRRACCAR